MATAQTQLPWQPLSANGVRGGFASAPPPFLSPPPLITPSLATISTTTSSFMVFSTVSGFAQQPFSRLQENKKSL